MSNIFWRIYLTLIKKIYFIYFDIHVTYIYFFNTCMKTMCFQTSKAGWTLLFFDQ